MKARRVGWTLGVVACGALIALGACGDKKGGKNNGPNNGTANNGTANNGTAGNNGPNNGTVANNGPNNGTNNGSNNGAMPAEFGLDARPANTTCLAFDRPPALGGLTTERAFPNLSFQSPVWLQQSPSAGDDRWFVIEQRGVIKTFANDEQAANTEDFLDIASRVSSGGERGMLGMAFHPDWPASPEVYVSYTRNQGGTESVISRFTSNDGGTTLDEASEEILLTLGQPFDNHNGGQISFGPDRYLYIGFGDGGSGGDPLGSGQDTSTLLGALLRIDVLGGTQPYGIPADNPFADGVGGREEIYAWGLRNPWRFSFDRETGELWLGDVGQGEWEEIDLIELGGNYGWDAKEGTRCYDTNPCDQGPWIDPIVEYDHSNGNRSVTGGYVYRGSAIESLRGIYVFADYATGRVWGIFPNEQTNQPEMRELMETGQPISSFGEGQNGELYIVHYNGVLARILASDPAAPTGFPQLLSETGCGDATDPKLPAAGLIPYDINAPFWSDGAEKARWFALPDGATITVEANGDWTFPTGAVLRKDFRIEGKLIETRLFVRHDDGEWGGYSYEWNDAQTDATYAQGGKRKDVGGQEWIFPSSGDCLSCHTAIAGRTLGPENAQLDRDFVYASTNRLSNQLKTLGHIGVFDTAPDADAVAALEDPMGQGDLAARARAYLHTNCAQCHRSGTALRPKFDLTAFTNPLIDDELCGADPIAGDLGVADAKRLVPGDPDHSLIWLRMQLRDANGMPPLGSVAVDTAGAELVRQWIESLGDCQL